MIEQEARAGCRPSLLRPQIRPTRVSRMEKGKPIHTVWPSLVMAKRVKPYITPARMVTRQA
jgi:hypothetical protein